jgi:hypothetical protein
LHHGLVKCDRYYHSAKPALIVSKIMKSKESWKGSGLRSGCIDIKDADFWEHEYKYDGK